MKSVIYLGATLMIGASVYGFTTYKQTQNSKEFREMYEVSSEAEEESADVDQITGIQAGTASLQKKSSNLSATKVVTLSALVEDQKVATVKVNDSKKIYRKAKFKKDKGLNTRLFSRAPLRQKPIEELTPVTKMEE